MTVHRAHVVIEDAVRWRRQQQRTAYEQTGVLPSFIAGTEDGPALAQLTARLSEVE